MSFRPSNLLGTVQVLIAAVPFVLAAAAQSVSFSGLGTLPGGTSSQARAISDDGLVVVGVSDTAVRLSSRAFRWTDRTGMVDLGTLPGASASDAYSTSADGSVVVGVSGGVAFRWTEEDGMVSMGVLPGQSTSTARGVSDDGSVIVGASGDFAFRWTAEHGMVSLGALPGEAWSAAYGVSGDGSTVVGLSGDSAFRWTSQQGFVDIIETTPDTVCTTYQLASANAVSGDGRVVAGSQQSTYAGCSGECEGACVIVTTTEVFRWTIEESVVPLWWSTWGPGPAINAVNNNGSLFVGTGGFGTAFAWNAKGDTIALGDYLAHSGNDLAEWIWGGIFVAPVAPGATGMSADGRTIVGANLHNGFIEAWIANVGDIEFPEADLSHDGFVDGLDVALLLGEWTGAASYPQCPQFIYPADLNGDCKINGFDLPILLAAWG